MQTNQLVKKIFSKLTRVIIIALVLSVTLFSSKVLAQAIWPGDSSSVEPGEYSKAEITWAFIRACVEEGKLKSQISTDSQNSGEIFIEKNNANIVVSNFVDADGTRACKNTVQTAAEALYGGKVAFLQAFYVQDPGTKSWIAKPSLYCDPPLSDTNPENSISCPSSMNEIIRTLRAKASGVGLFELSLDGDSPRLGPNYVWGVLNPLYSKCLKTVDAENNSPDVTIDGVGHTYKIDKGTSNNVGYIIDPRGRLTCEEIADKLSTDEYSYATLTTEEIQEQIDSQDKDQKIQDITNLLNSNSASLVKCTGFSTAFTAFPTEESSAALSEWLVDGGHIYSVSGRSATQSIYVTSEEVNTTSTRIFSDDEETLVKKCLTDEYGEELLTALAAVGGTAPSSTASSTSTTESDVCLSEGDNFISWAACPMINLLNDAFDKIKDTLQDMLKFSIEDSGPGTAGSVNELENAWNVFRGIASILIIIFFLTALLVKSIKGE